MRLRESLQWWVPRQTVYRRRAVLEGTGLVLDDKEQARIEAP